MVNKPAISAVGQSEVGRRLGRTGMQLTVEAVKAALEDAELSITDIDGIASWPGRASLPGFSPVGVDEVIDTLGLDVNWFCGGSEGPGQLASIINAYAAVSAGLARHVLCFRTLTEGSSRGEQAPFAQPDGYWQWLLPFHAYSATNWVAMYAQRYFHEFGTTREQLAQIALNARKNAQLNPDAVYRTALSMDDYLQARMISSPLCLYDCDVPVDASTVIIVSSADAAAEFSKQAITIESIGCAVHDRYSWDQFSDLTTMAARDAASMMWSRTDLKPADVDMAQLYDGFSIIALMWLEAMGFCGKGEAGAFVDGGQRISLGGDLPLNTGGGQLSAGRVHGFGYVYEACKQLRGEAGDRQLRNDPTVAAVGVGGGPLGGCLLLTRE